MRFFLFALLLVPLVSARRRQLSTKRIPPPRPLTRLSDFNANTGEAIPSEDTQYTFDQLIDHTNPSLGTFKQRYWVSQEFYSPGGPIVLTTPGEETADGYLGYLDNGTVVGAIAQQQNGASVVLEHRYYGQSNPVANLSVANLKYHTIPQAIEDVVYFAENVHLPIPGGDQVSPSHAPWVLVGGSYAGTLTAWTLLTKPDVFHAGWASSATVESISYFWEYFEPVRQNMPQNCSADVVAALTHIDGVLTSGNSSAIDTLVGNFGFPGLNHSRLDDFASDLRAVLFHWQDLQPGYNYSDSWVHYFCDRLETKDDKIAPASGWGATNAVEAWARFFRDTWINTDCGQENPLDCLSSYNLDSSYWWNVTLGNDNRSYQWIRCNDIGYSQSGAPAGHPSIISRLVTPAYDSRRCKQMFPGAFTGSSTEYAVGVNVTNNAYGGFNIKANRLFFANGKQDPWLWSTVSSPLVSVASTAQQPIAVGNGYHCSDLLMYSGVADPTVAAVQKAGLGYIKGWLAEWKPASPKRDHAKRGAYLPRGNRVW
ncbi:peptidase S28 [Artomyces pyxidatus]|uniref:Peptidase S28 n=1 Tax=Artomyces pyxidatus TaxID=48021 RepID=A0ACB8T9E0_9AGAM|nr:peptidase S28 [Artomyces pyxidatus]